jgi:hypothetical protein
MGVKRKLPTARPTPAGSGTGPPSRGRGSPSIQALSRAKAGRSWIRYGREARTGWSSTGGYAGVPSSPANRTPGPTKVHHPRDRVGRGRDRAAWTSLPPPEPGGPRARLFPATRSTAGGGSRRPGPRAMPSVLQAGIGPAAVDGERRNQDPATILGSRAFGFVRRRCQAQPELQPRICWRSLNGRGDVFEYEEMLVKPAYLQHPRHRRLRGDQN